jgi:predicted acyltransferase
MSKAMTIFGLVVAGLMVLVFAIDWATGIPFQTADWTMNFGAIAAGAILGYLSWDAFREIP